MIIVIINIIQHSPFISHRSLFIVHHRHRIDYAAHVQVRQIVDRPCQAERVEFKDSDLRFSYSGDGDDDQLMLVMILILVVLLLVLTTTGNDGHDGWLL